MPNTRTTKKELKNTKKSTLVKDKNKQTKKGREKKKKK